MYFRPSQWVVFVLTNTISKLRAWIPAMRQWAWYGFRRGLLVCALKYAIDNFWLCFKKRKLGVSFMRELSMINWVAPSLHYEMDARMRLFIRKCGFHFTPTGIGIGKKVQPWFYGEVRDDTKEILDRMDIKAMKQLRQDKRTQAEEMQAVIRVLRNFKEFTMNEIMVFFKKSELVTMEKDQVIFGSEDQEDYFYGVVSGEIHLFADGIGNQGVELIKVAGSDDCITSISAVLHIFADGALKYGDLKLSAVCGVAGKYYKIPIQELFNYMEQDSKKMFEILSTTLIRLYKYGVGLNELTGILPRLFKQSFLDASYDPIQYEPGIITDKDITDAAFEALAKIFPVKVEDRKLCWVGVLDSRTILLRSYKKSHYAFYIHKGLLACTISKIRRSYNAVQYYLKEGQIVGWRESLLGLEMAVQYQVADRAKALVVAIPSFLIRTYVERNPPIVKGLISKLTERYCLLYRQLNYAMRFTGMKANEAVYRKADLHERVETHAYLCLSGRLRFILEHDREVNRTKGTASLARYGIIEGGDWFGLAPMYADKPLSHRTVICDRCADYVAVPRYIISIITRTFREAAGYQCDYLASCIHRDHSHTFLDTDKMADTRFQVNSFGVHSWRTYRVVCVYPATPEIPAKIYCDELARHHTSAASVVTKEDALAGLELSELHRDNEYSLAKWIVQEEEKNTVLFVLATGDSNGIWDTTIAKLCDMIQVLVTYQVPYKPTPHEINMLEMAVKARKELVFIHPVIRVTRPQIGPTKFPHLPHGSILWLKPRNKWVQRHHHVRMLDSALRYMKEKNPADLEKYLKETKDPDKHSDFGRVMRWISGQSIGVVLGGGGAKGAAHLGALHYLHELDVPVDYIAGVSMGSFLGALYATYENIHTVEFKAKELWEELKNLYRYVRDVTIPIYSFSSLFRGHSFNWMIQYFFENIQIEDLYIPFFCVSSDLQDMRSRTHMSGDLWFYVRASMTLTLVFPPQLNQFDYHLLMDGGYSDLVPAMTMRRLGIKYLVAINIGDDRLIKTFNIGYHVSGFKCLLQSLLPNSIDSIPNHFDFWDAILFCSARNFLQILKAMDEYCIYIRPNINAYTALDFHQYDEIKTLGYLSTKFKFGGLHLKNLPVHVIWYLLRFYTYPSVASSQAQILQGFTDDDWKFAVNLMKKTQMYQRATTTFLKMNLTPYLVDLMEARSYLEVFLEEDEIRNINMNVPVLENFSRDDERLDLLHAMARLKEVTYMEDFESILEGGLDQADLSIKTKVHAVASQIQDLLNARVSSSVHGPKFIHLDSLKESYSIQDLLDVDPSLFEAVAQYSRFHRGRRQSQLGSELYYTMESNNGSRVVSGKPSRTGPSTTRLRKTGQSLPSLHQIALGYKAKPKYWDLVTGPAQQGQRLEEFRKCWTSVDRKRRTKEIREEKLTPILTLKELRKSFNPSTPTTEH